MAATLTPSPGGVTVTGASIFGDAFLPVGTDAQVAGPWVQATSPGGVQYNFDPLTDLGEADKDDALAVLSTALANANADVNPVLFRVGNYVKTLNRNGRTSGVGTPGQATYLPGLNTAKYCLFYNKKAYTADRVGASVVTADVAGTFRVALYQVSGTGTPGTKIYETGTLSGAATGAVEETPVTAVTIPAGWLMIAAITNSATLSFAALQVGAYPLQQGTSNAVNSYVEGTFSHTYTDPLPDNPTGCAVNTANSSGGTLTAFFRIASL